MSQPHKALSVLLVLGFSVGTPAALVAESNLTEVVKQVREEVRPEEAMDFMRRIHATDRWFTFPKFHQTAGYLQRTMQELELKDVELVKSPADGVTQVGYWTMPLAWDVKTAKLEILDSSLPAEARLLADYQQVPASLGMWSGASPPEGVEAEVVDVKPVEAEKIARLDLRGKLALTRVNPAEIKWALVRAGALGAINTFTENPDLQNGRQWINAWGDNGWAFTKGSTPLLCFSITPRQAALLRKLLGEKGTVRVKATVDSRHYSDTYPYVTGTIPGETSEEVLTLGHSAEQGAQDNATGVAAMLEAVAALNRLITSGKLPKPKRTSRILAMGELYASMHYVASNPQRIRRTIAAMCVDTPAASYDLAGTEYTFYLNPHVAKSYTDALILRVAEEYFPQVKRPWHEHDFMTGTDTYLAEPTVDIPTVWGYSGSGVPTHHNSEDTPNRVDARSLRDIAIIDAALLYYVANAGEAQARWLAELSESRGYEQILRAAAPWLDRVLAENDSGQLGLRLGEGLAQISYAADRETQAVRSVSRLVPEERREALRESTAPLAARLQRFGEEQSARLREAVQARARQLGISDTIQPAAKPDSQLEAASKIIVKRKRFGSIPLDEIGPDQREGQPSGAWASVPTIALYWCDGRRTLAEVIHLTRMELGPTDFDFVSYFRFLQRRGYVEFVPR